jgi:hypothetical protein
MIYNKEKIKMDIRSFVGKRCLLKTSAGYSSNIDEYKVLEVSPSGNWVKIMNLNGHKFWKAVQDVSFIEELIDFRNDKPLE